MMTEMMTVSVVFCIRGRNKVGAAHFLVSLAQILGVGRGGGGGGGGGGKRCDGIYM